VNTPVAARNAMICQPAADLAASMLNTTGPLTGASNPVNLMIAYMPQAIEKR
jgi:hypothetical protein